MKFPLIHTGRRFFFFTFVVEGRQAILSRLERGAKRPVLMPPGERVKDVWVALHQINPHFTASDFVIMPDHVHLLLIVNSADEFRFNPLVFAHWFMAASTSNGGLPPPIPCMRWDVPSYWQGSGQPEAPSLAKGGQTPAFAWSQDFWVDISFDSHQLTAI